MLGVEDHNARQLVTVPGIGPLIASAVVAALPHSAGTPNERSRQPKNNMHRLY
jgi:hypothetical protein